MAFLSRDEVKSIVTSALEEVATLSGEIEDYKMSVLKNELQVIFMNAIQKKLNDKGFRVTLSLSKLQSFETMGDLINYITENQGKLP